MFGAELGKKLFRGLRTAGFLVFRTLTDRFRKVRICSEIEEALIFSRGEKDRLRFPFDREGQVAAISAEQPEEPLRVLPELSHRVSGSVFRIVVLFSRRVQLRFDHGGLRC
jgi:hypothetical protein